MMRRLEFFARRDDFANGVSLYLRERPGDGRTLFASPVEMVEMKQDPGVYSPAQPMVSLALDEAQRLMDELWQCGLRPSEGTGSAGSLAATERHLADMRKVAFAALKRGGVEVGS